MWRPDAQPNKKPDQRNPSIFAVPSWSNGQQGGLAWPSAPDEPWRAKAELLEATKRRAAGSFARTIRGDCKTAIDGWAADEQAVLRARIDLLNTLMVRHDDARLLCLENTQPPRVCVQYNRMRCEGETDLAPMQSTMAWVVPGAEVPVQQLVTAGEQAQAGTVKALLAMVRASMPRKKDTLNPLDAVLGMAPPERLVLKSVAGVNAHPAHTRVAEGLGAQAEGLAPLYKVVWGALDVSAQEPWQNPSTNASIRMSVLDTAHQAAREAARSKLPLWANVSFLQIRIQHGDEAHVLGLTPFADSDSCTVTHLQYAQSVFDDSGPERGILNLSQDPAHVHPIPMGKVLPLRAFVCVGAHRKSRLSEAQLNYVHAQGLLAHGFALEHLPRPELLRFDQRMPAAKSTRVSATGVDVLASSYHVADQVYTTISVVQYPPFGTQFAPETAAKIGQHVERASSRTTRMHGDPFSVMHFDPNKTGTRKTLNKTGSRKSTAVRIRQGTFDLGSDDEKNQEDGGDEDDQGRNDRWADQQSDNGEQEDMQDEEEDKIPLYILEKLPGDEDLEMMSQEAREKHAKPDNWSFDMLPKNHYFVDGVVGDPFDLSKRFILFEPFGTGEYTKAQGLAISLKEHFIQHHKHVWDSNRTFYWNIKHNESVGTDGQTIGAVWRNNWKKHIEDDTIHFNQGHMVANKLNLGGNDQPQIFWYTKDNNQWDAVIKTNPFVLENVPGWSLKWFEHFKKEHVLHPLSKPRDQIRIPEQLRLKRASLMQGQAKHNTEKADLSQLSARISALESRLRRVRQEDNTQALLEQVLERLEE